MASVAIDPVALDAARRLVAIARARYPVVEAWLYGSHARGDAHGESDVDVAVVVEQPREERWRIGGDLAEEAADLLLETGAYTSPLVLAADDWRNPEHFSNPFLLRNIRRDGIAL